MKKNIILNCTDKQLYDIAIDIYDISHEFKFVEYTLNIRLSNDFNKKILIDFLRLLDDFSNKYDAKFILKITRE